MIQTNTDTQCREILQRHADGFLTPTETRKQLAEALHRSGIAAMVAGEKTNQTMQFRRDVTAEMEDLLFTKMMQETDGGFDLGFGVDASVAGWARGLLRTARPSIVRNITTRTIARIDLVDPTPPTTNTHPSTAGTSYRTFHGATREDELPADQGHAMMVATDWLRSKNRHLRDNSRLAAEAAAFMHGYSVPAPIRFRLAERKRLKALLVKDPSLAHRSVKAMYAIVGSEPFTDQIDDGFLALWDDYSYEHLETIAGTDPKVALTLADAAVSDRARPSRTVLASFNASVRALGTGKGWRRLAAEACESFIALEFEAYSAFDTTGAEYRAERVAGRRIACMKSASVFARALAHPGQRLGLTEDDMYAQLERLISNLTEFEVMEPAA
jgi:hypothetical protein